MRLKEATFKVSMVGVNIYGEVLMVTRV
jgi:hypothetical protein